MHSRQGRKCTYECLKYSILVLGVCIVVHRFLMSDGFMVSIGLPRGISRGTDGDDI